MNEKKKRKIMDIVLMNRQSAEKLPLKLIRQIVEFVVSNELDLYTRSNLMKGDPYAAQFIVTLVNEKQMLEWNQKVFKKNKPTDVISMGYPEEIHFSESILGEVIVSVEEAQKVHRKFKKSVLEEVLLYCIHGVLHAFGHDDLKPAPRALMRRREAFYMDLFSALLKYQN